MLRLSCVCLRRRSPLGRSCLARRHTAARAARHHLSSDLAPPGRWRARLSLESLTPATLIRRPAPLQDTRRPPSYRKWRNCVVALAQRGKRTRQNVGCAADVSASARRTMASNYWMLRKRFLTEDAFNRRPLCIEWTEWRCAKSPMTGCPSQIRVKEVSLRSFSAGHFHSLTLLKRKRYLAEL